MRDPKALAVGVVRHVHGRDEGDAVGLHQINLDALGAAHGVGVCAPTAGQGRRVRQRGRGRWAGVGWGGRGRGGVGERSAGLECARVTTEQRQLLRAQFHSLRYDQKPMALNRAMNFVFSYSQ